MRFSHSKTDQTAKRLSRPRQPVRCNVGLGFGRRVLWDRVHRVLVLFSLPLKYVSLCGAWQLPSPMILSLGNAYSSGLPRVLIANLTVKVRNKNAENFLPSDLPSKLFAGIAPKYAGGAKKHLTAQRVSDPSGGRQLLTFGSVLYA